MFNLSRILPKLDANTQLSLTIVFLISLGVFAYLSLFGLAGVFGGLVASVAVLLLGRGAFFVPIIFFVMAAIFFKIQQKNEPVEGLNSRLVWGTLFVTLSINGYFSFFEGIKELDQLSNGSIGGGLSGYFMYPFIFGRFGIFGGFFFLFAVFLVGFFFLSQLTFVDFVANCAKCIKNPSFILEFVPDFFTQSQNTDSSATQNLDEEISQPSQNTPASTINNQANNSQSKNQNNNKNQAKSSVKTAQEIDDRPVVNQPKVVDVFANPVKKKAEVKPKQVFNFDTADDASGVMEMKSVLQEKPTQSDSQTSTFQTVYNWDLPAFDILKENKTKVEPGDIENNKQIIKQTLGHFGILVEMHDTFVGPTVTQYTMKPANGVKLSTIDSLQRDLALALAAPNIRIEAPIAGQSLVGVEIPNTKKSQVRLRDIIQTHSFLNYENPLPVAIGKDVSGHNLMYSLAKMPHLLVAGATGAGKSVWINGLLLSLLYRYSPKELQLILIDMKRVELKLYDGIPHLLSKVITSAEEAVNSLKWLVLEMDRRYILLEENGRRNIEDYNTYARGIKQQELPYVVTVIDELGDLMMLAKSEVEPMVVRLTQMARAVGLHIVLGTQRPDTHVVTGLIKANIPTRIAFAVASQIDSRVILDKGGAEKLLGQGDGLIITPSSMHAIRFQGPYVEDDEVKKCIQFLKRQAQELNIQGNQNVDVTGKQKERINIPGMVESVEGDSDEAIDEARRIIIQYQKASTSFLQQMMGIGYPKAAKIMMQLEQEGVVGPANGSKSRDVYLTPEDIGGII